MLTVGAQLAEVPADAVSAGSGGAIEALVWSPRGEMLAGISSSSTVHCYLGVLPSVAAAGSGCIAHMSLLAECTVQSCDAAENFEVQVPLAGTPHCLALCGTYLAASMNNCVYTYDLVAPLAPVHVREYPGGAVEALQLSETHVAVLLNGRVLAHALCHDTECNTPYREQDVTAFALTASFLILATSKGQLQHYAAADGSFAPLNEYCHARGETAVGITQVWAPPGVVHMVFLDNEGKLYVFTPVNDQVCSVGLMLFVLCSSSESCRLRWSASSTAFVHLFKAGSCSHVILQPPATCGSDVQDMQPSCLCAGTCSDMCARPS